MDGSTTEMPTREILAEFKQAGFWGAKLSSSCQGAVWQALGGRPDSRLFDISCSPGCGSYPVQQAGDEVDPFEISAPHAAYARPQLGVKVIQSEAMLDNHYDFVFSSPVLEHVSAVADALETGLRGLRPRGLFIAFTPNGSNEYRQAVPQNGHPRVTLGTRNSWTVPGWRHVLCLRCLPVVPRSSPMLCRRGISVVASWPE